MDSAHGSTPVAQRIVFGALNDLFHLLTSLYPRANQTLGTEIEGASQQMIDGVGDSHHWDNILVAGNSHEVGDGFPTKRIVLRIRNVEVPAGRGQHRNNLW